MYYHVSEVYFYVYILSYFFSDRQNIAMENIIGPLTASQGPGYVPKIYSPFNSNGGKYIHCHRPP